MTFWSSWLTDPDAGGSPLPDGTAFWVGGASTTRALDVAQGTYHPTAGNGTTDVFDIFIQSYRDTDGNPSATTATFGIDASWITNPAVAFPLPLNDPAGIPSALHSRWAGGWQWADTHGTLYRPSGLTVGFGAVLSGSTTSTVFPPMLLWVDTDVTWAGSRMQAPAYNPSTRLTRWGTSPAHVRWTSTPPTAPSLSVPIDYLEAHSYRVAVTVALDMDIPAFDGTGAVYELFQQQSLAGVSFTFPQFRITLRGQPPLRQYPRDDALGGAPRQGKSNGSTSVQASARQGWVNSYR